MFQLGAALLDACVLAVLAGGDTYGYALTQSIKTVIDVSESTLYPVLRRLQKDALLGVYDQPYNGRNRRYYQITAAGTIRLGELVRDWQAFKGNIDKILTDAPAGDAPNNSKTMSLSAGNLPKEGSDDRE